MFSEVCKTDDRVQQLDYVGRELLPRAGLLTRLLLPGVGGDLSRTELGLLSTLSGGPRRITELAQLERLAQPTMTLLVQRLEHRGLVTRERQANDGRVVLAALTGAGEASLEAYRARMSSALSVYLADLPDAQVEELVAATETLVQLTGLLQHGPVGV